MKIRTMRRAPSRATVSLAAVALAPAVDEFRRAHLNLAEREIDTGQGRARVTVDEGESPLAWLARRRGRDGRAMIEPAQWQAGERLRAEFTRAQMTPRMTTNWSSPVSGAAAGGEHASEAILAARQRLRRALEAAGPEFSGLLLDVCCFLKRLEAVERERQWPARSAKIVLQLALDRLARHYGYAETARGPASGAVRAWRD